MSESNLALAQALPYNLAIEYNLFMKAKILLVEDDWDLVQNLSSFLAGESYLVQAVSGQQAALDLLQKQNFDLVLLDVNLKEGDGFSACKHIKETYDLPIIFLTALADEYSTVNGLDLGAEDYVSKPFRPRELLSRINNVLRRRSKEDLVQIGDLLIDTQKAQVKKKGQELSLSVLEYKLLLMFINRRGQLVSRDNLVDEIYNLSGELVQDNSITVYIKRLREKIEDRPGQPQYIKTVRGLGYRLD